MHYCLVVSYSSPLTCEFWKFLSKDILIWFNDFRRIITFPCFFTDSGYVTTPLLQTLRELLPNCYRWTADFRTLSSVSLILKIHTQLWCRSKYRVRESGKGWRWRSSIGVLLAKRTKECGAPTDTTSRSTNISSVTFWTFPGKAPTYVWRVCHVYNYRKIQDVLMLWPALQFPTQEDTVSNVGKSIGFTSNGTIWGRAHSFYIVINNIISARLAACVSGPGLYFVAHSLL